MAIMQSVLQKFASRAKNSAQAQKRVNQAGNPRAQPIELAPQYLELEQLCSQRQLLKVAVTGYTGSYQSMILAIDQERSLIWLDDLFPSQRHLSAGDDLEISHHRNGELISFKAPILALGQRFGATGIALALPVEAPRYRPRRQWPRLELSTRQALSATLAIAGKGPVQARVLNISAGGLRLALAGNWLSHFRHGELLPLCELTLLAGIKIRCRARVCAFNISQNPRRQTEVSLAFKNLDPVVQQNLRHYIAARTALKLAAQAA